MQDTDGDSKKELLQVLHGSTRCANVMVVEFAAQARRLETAAYAYDEGPFKLNFQDIEVFEAHLHLGAVSRANFNLWAFLEEDSAGRLLGLRLRILNETFFGEGACDMVVAISLCGPEVSDTRHDGRRSRASVVGA